MNWIGGSLSRYSKLRPPNHQQRIHSEWDRPQQKARKQINLSPFRPNFMQACQDGNAFYTHNTRNSTKQRTMDEYPDMAPLIQGLESTQIPRLSHDIKTSSQSPLKLQISSNSSIRSCLELAKPQSPSAGHAADEKEQDEPIHQKNQYNTSMQSDAAAFERRKLRMLGKPDWAGLRYIRPVHVKLGKRKREVIERPCIGAHIKTPVLETVDIRYHIQPEAKSQQNSDVVMTGALPRIPDVEIRIGTDALQSTRLCTSDDAILSIAQSNDGMLFDSLGNIGIEMATSKSPDQPPNRKGVGDYEKCGISTLPGLTPPTPNFLIGEENHPASYRFQFITQCCTVVRHSPRQKPRSAKIRATKMPRLTDSMTAMPPRAIPDRLADPDSTEACDYGMQLAEAESKGYANALFAGLESSVEQLHPKPILGYNLSLIPTNTSDLIELQRLADQPTKASESEVDEDTIWREFVFGPFDDSESNSRGVTNDESTERSVESRNRSDSAIPSM
jgi:hypothetical protein